MIDFIQTNYLEYVVKKITLGIDFDDTLVNFAPHWQDYHTTMYGKFDEMLWGTDEGLRRGHEFVNSYHHELIPAIDGAVEAVQLLSKKRTLVIVTARDALLSNATHILLEKLFPRAFKDVYFLHKEKKNVLGTKADVCLKYGIGEFVDDSIQHITTTSSAGIRSFLFTTPLNQHENVSGVTRIASWKELLHHIS